ncbi:MAG: hypothetical protein FWF60_04040 [Oscillospiraceae bacterium]|nr:hypothetical protein [Oscillospiraceae bacterium]
MKKALSALLAAVMVLGLLALAPITAHAATIEVANATQFGNALAQPGDNTIRLTDNITYDVELWISAAKTITLDLNGKTLNFNNRVCAGGGGKLLLAAPANGQFNLSYSGGSSAAVWAGDDSIVEVTNVNGTGNFCAVCGTGGEVVVYGNVTGGNVGAYADCGGKVTIDGTLTTSGTYIQFWDDDNDIEINKTAAQFSTPTTKTGYKTYTDGTSTVWVKCAAHTPGDWIVDTQPTATVAGSKHKECTACGQVTATEVIPATGGGDTGDYFVLWGKTTTYLKSNFWNWILLIFLFGWIWMAF